MGRPRAYDPDEVVERAKRLFMRDGYGETSVADLVDRLGVSRSSLYDAFGDKDGLYLRALDHYVANDLTGGLSLLDAPGPVRQRLAAFLGALVDAVVVDPGRGCLIVTTLVERGPHDEASTDRARSALQQMEDCFEAALAEARRTGELRSHIAPDTGAQLLLAHVNGLQLLLKSEPDPARLHAGTAALLDALLQAGEASPPLRS